jgi:ethanolamine utilization protein EutN
MNLARVVGKVWATRKDPQLEQATLLVIQPVDDQERPCGERLAAVDTRAAQQGQLVFYVGSKEAALPLPGELVPVDACIVGIVDRLDRD